MMPVSGLASPVKAGAGCWATEARLPSNKAATTIVEESFMGISLTLLRGSDAVNILLWIASHTVQTLVPQAVLKGLSGSNNAELVAASFDKLKASIREYPRELTATQKGPTYGF